jgi:transposase
VPGVGPVVALTYATGIDDPGRFARSRDIGPHFGLTPRKYASGEIDRNGSITKAGDGAVREALVQAALSLLTLLAGRKVRHKDRSAGLRTPS